MGEERSQRSHEIRDLLQRHDLPYGFYDSESEVGRAALAHAEASAERLPVVIMLDGRVLIDPTNREVAEALGAGVRPADVTYDVVIVGGADRRGWRPPSTPVRRGSAPRWSNARRWAVRRARAP